MDDVPESNLEVATTLLRAAAMVTGADDPLPPDVFDDNDIGVMALINAAMGVAELLRSRDGFATDLLARRLALIVSADGVDVLTRGVDPLSHGV